MITVRHAVDVAEVKRLQLTDPFQLAPPAWQHCTTFLLPPETVKINVGEIQRMAIKAVPVDQAPSRLHGKVSHNQDFADVMAAIKNDATNPVKKATALVVSMSDPSWMAKNEKGEPKYEKPEVTFAGVLRRHFTAAKLSLTAYQSGKMEVTVKKGEPVNSRK